MTFLVSRRSRRAAAVTLCAFTAACVLSAYSSKAALTTATWGFTGQTGAGPYAGTIGGGTLLSSPSLTYAGGGTPTIASAAGFTGAGDNYLLITGKGTQVNGSTLAFTLTPSSGIQLTTLTFNYDPIGATSATGISWAVSGGASGTITSSTLTQDTGWATAGTVDLSGLSFTSGSFTITGTLTGATGNANGSGVIRFDNFAITAVPEPINYALAGFGFLFVGGSAGRFYLARRRSVMAS